jgi:hypothetical protein
MFNKEEYWKNRKIGKRGQGEFNPIVAIHTPKEWKIIKQKEKYAKIQRSMPSI